MYKVIIADDNALSIKGMEANLDFAALDARLAGSFLSGEDVMTYLREHPDVDLLVSDIRMPHMTGLELAREALCLNPQIKIVLISAYDDFEYAQEALRIGVLDYVQKPIQYSILQEAMRKALAKLEDERDILRRLEEAAPEMRRRFYQDLIQAHPLLACQMLEKDAAYLGVATEGGSFMALAIAWEDEKPQDTRTLLLNTIALETALQQRLDTVVTCQIIRERDTLLAVLHDGNKSGAELTALIRDICETFAKEHAKLTASLRFGLGTAVNSLWDMPLSMDAAQRALNRRYLFPGQSVFQEQIESNRSLVFMTHLIDSQMEIVQMLLRRDSSALESMIPRLATEVMAELKVSSLIIPYLVVLCSGIVGQMHQDGLNLDDAYRTLNNLSTHGRRTTGAKELTNFLLQFFRQITDALEHSQLSYQRQLISRVKEYIDSQLGDSGLRLETIAQEAHVTASHLSRMFKRLEGANVSDYITRKRIDKARQLLRGTPDSITQISGQVGYASPYYFSACFKKYTGMTPSEYRTAKG